MGSSSVGGRTRLRQSGPALVSDTTDDRSWFGPNTASTTSHTFTVSVDRSHQMARKTANSFSGIFKDGPDIAAARTIVASVRCNPLSKSE